MSQQKRLELEIRVDRVVLKLSLTMLKPVWARLLLSYLNLFNHCWWDVYLVWKSMPRWTRFSEFVDGSRSGQVDERDRMK
jgi:hypothetical protein